MAELLRLATAGSVDDGKSTLIGRLLYDAKGIFEDQLEAIRRTSEQRGNAETDLALLTDGLRAEREQGITIDVAYRYFATPKRKFIIADTPGHTEYTRNMVTGRLERPPGPDPDRRPQGRDRADPAPRLPLLHAGHPPHGGLRQQDGPGRLGPGRVRAHQGRLHGVRRPAQRARHHLHPDLGPQGRQRGAPLGEPVVVRRARRCCRHLESVYIGSDENLIDPRFPVQYVIRSQTAERIPTSGATPARWPAGCSARATRCWSCRRAPPRAIASIATADGEVAEAFPPMAVVITLDRRHRGVAGRRALPAQQPADRGTGHSRPRSAGWTSARAWPSGAPTCIKHNTRTVRALVQSLQYRLDINGLHRDDEAATLGLNEIGRVRLPHHRAPAGRRLHHQPVHRQLHHHRPGHQRHRRGRGHPGHRRQPRQPQRGAATGAS